MARCSKWRFRMLNRHTKALAVLTFLVAFLSACSNNETPTEPGRFPSGSSGTVHVVGLNSSAGNIGLWEYTPPLTDAVLVRPGESVEMFRLNTRNSSDFFLVFKPIGDHPLFQPVASVAYKVLTAPAWPYDEVTATVRVSMDPAGAVTAVSEKPDVVQIVSVTPQ
jgi:hypothetical protein